MDPDLTLNALLAALPQTERDRLAGGMEVLDLPIRTQVHAPREPVDAVYFPLTAVFSMVATADERLVVEVGTIGYEGMVGLPLFLGAPVSPNAVFCQIAGTAARVGAADFAAYLAHDGALHRLLHRYTQAMMVQVAQNVVCNSTHPADQRMGRWLLMSADRTRSETFDMTQDFLGQMLGVRRGTVSEVAAKLQADGLIRYNRGAMTIADRAGLLDRACSCYAVVRQEFDRLAQG